MFSKLILGSVEMALGRRENGVQLVIAASGAPGLVF